MAVLSTVLRAWRWRGAGGWRSARWLALALLLPTGGHSAPPPPVSAEYQLKAVFLYNFAQFVEWPPKAFAEPTSPFVIGVLGEDPFGVYLDELVHDEKIGDRPLVIHRTRRLAELGNCHIVFVCRSEARDLDRILAALKDRSVLTVSDADTFIRQGGMVRFAAENGKIRLRINVEAARADHLTISSKILRPGTLVTPGKD